MTTLTRAEITKLTPPERLTLIGDLWDSITDADLPVPAAQRRELDEGVFVIACFHSSRDPLIW